MDVSPINISIYNDRYQNSWMKVFVEFIFMSVSTECRKYNRTTMFPKQRNITLNALRMK